MANNKLNARQHRFVINLFQGMSQTDAYINAGYDVAPSVAAANSTDLLKIPKIYSELDSLNRRRQDVVLVAETDNNILAALTKSEKRAILADVLRNGQPTTETHYNRKIEGQPGITATMTRRDIIAAIAEDNKMSGDYAPSKHLVAQRVIFEVNQVDKKKRGEE